MTTFRFILIFCLLFRAFGTWAQDTIPANTQQLGSTSPRRRISCRKSIVTRQ